MNEQESMNSAYRIAQELLNDRLKERAPEAYDTLRDIPQADVVVVQGCYDRIEQVLSLAGTPFLLVRPDELARADLRPDQIVFVNCPGNVDAAGLRRLSAFVNDGGFLFTTDWALKHVLESAFPGYVEFNGRSTRDEVVRVEVLDNDDPFLRAILGPEDDPQWWLEGSSYPIRIVNEGDVKVLVTSREIYERYGEAPVFAAFNYGDGKVYHMLSHFYLQRCETRTRRHSACAADYLAEKEIPASLRAKYEAMGIRKRSLGQVESAYASSAMVNKILYDKRRHTSRRKEV